MSNHVGSDGNNNNNNNGNNGNMDFVNSTNVAVLRPPQQRTREAVVVVMDYWMDFKDELMASTERLFQSKFNYLILLGPLAILGDATGTLGESLCFCFSGIALIPCAERLSFITEQVAEHTNGTIGALLNATFGNAPELLISVAALRAGYYRVVQLAMLGSMLTNMMFVFGLSCFIGGVRWQVQELRSPSGNVNVLMLLVATAGSLFPAALKLSGQLQHNIIPSQDDETAPSPEEVLFCRINAAVMLILYLAFLLFQLNTHKDEYDEDEAGYQAKRARRNLVCLGMFHRIHHRVTGSTFSRVSISSTSRHQHYHHHRHHLTRSNVFNNDTSDEEIPLVLSAVAAPGAVVVVGAAAAAAAAAAAPGTDVNEAGDDSDNSSTWGNDDPDHDDEEMAGPLAATVAPLNVMQKRPTRHRPLPQQHPPQVSLEMTAVTSNDNDNASSNHNNSSSNKKTKNTDAPRKSKNSDNAEPSPDGGGGGGGGGDDADGGIVSDGGRNADIQEEADGNKRDANVVGMNILDNAGTGGNNDYGNHEARDALHNHLHPLHHIKHNTSPVLSMRVGIVWLFVITVCISAMSDILVDTIDEFSQRMHLSQVFTTMVIIPFFSNVAEQVSAFLFAYRNEMDLMVGVTVGSAIQIATFVLPGSVLIGCIMDRPMTLYFQGYETCCLFFCVLVLGAVLQGGTTNWMTGATLVGIYVMLATGIWFHELEALTDEPQDISNTPTVNNMDNVSGGEAGGNRWI